MNFSYDKAVKTTGGTLMFLLVLVIMIDPTNTVLHLKDVLFVLCVGFNAVVYKPDLSKIPIIAVVFCCMAMAWIVGLISGARMDGEMAIAGFKSVSPLVLLLWIKYYDILSFAKPTAMIATIIVLLLYSIILIFPISEYPIYMYAHTHNDFIHMSVRSILGIKIFGMYYGSTIAFLLPMMTYFYATFHKKTRTVSGTLCFILLFIYFFLISNTRSTILSPFFLLCVVGYHSLKTKKNAKYIIYPLLALVGIAFIVTLFAMMSETTELSNVVKYGHLNSYEELFGNHPWYLLFGEGPGTSFFSEGFNAIVYETEWSYLEIIRLYGALGFPIIFVFIKPLFTFWNHRSDDYTNCFFWTYVAYLFIAGTNPLMISSTGMIILLTAYSYEEKLKRERPSVPVLCETSAVQA